MCGCSGVNVFGNMPNGNHTAGTKKFGSRREISKMFPDSLYEETIQRASEKRLSCV